MTLTPTELDALQLALPQGAENGTTVYELARCLRWNERKVRQGFQMLRRDRHVPVVALPVSNGCFIATRDDIEAIQRTRDGLHSRAMHLHVTVRDLDEIIADMAWQPTLFAVNE